MTAERVVNMSTMINGKDIRSLRMRKGLRLKDLAKLANVSSSKLSKCERGLILPKRDFFVAISNVLSVPPDNLSHAHSKLLKTAVTGEGYTTRVPNGSYVVPRRQRLSSSTVPIVDLFCGVGGFSHGFEQTGHFQVSAGIDLLPDRIKTFCENHPAATGFCTDIKTLSLHTLVESGPKPEVIIGGPPCQGFSSIRPFRTLTEKDPRNNLFEYFTLTVDALKPRWFVLENVVGLKTHRQGRTLKTIINLFEQIGYKTEWRVLNAALYGLPQRRERLILIGNSMDRSFKWPIPTHYYNGRTSCLVGKCSGKEMQQLSLFEGNQLSAVTVMEAIHDLPEIEAGESAHHYREDVMPTKYEKAMRGCEKRLTLHEATKHSPRMIEIIKQAGYNRAALPEGLTTSGFSSSYSRLEPDIPSVTLTVNFVHPSSNKCIHPYQNRALTPREGARIQGFEDSYKFLGTRSQIVKQIGNAVPPILGRVIADALIEQGLGI